LLHVTPYTFAVLRRITIFAPTVITLALAAWFLAWFARWQHLSTFDMVFGFGVGSLSILGYAIWAIANDWHGLVRVPRKKWTIHLDEGAILLRTKRLQTRIATSSVTEAHLVRDGSWETLRGVEDVCLVLKLAGWLSISVPGSSDGYAELLEKIRERHTVETLELEV
jgi:hypothetical protein